MPEAVNGTGESQPADDLRSLLAAAHDEHVQEETPALANKAETPKEEADGADEAQAEQGEAAPEGEQRDRDPDGKFAKKEDSEAEGEQPTGKKIEGLEPPVNWKAADKEAFKKLPGEAQKILVDRQRDMDADYTRKTQALAAFRSKYEPIDKLFEPHRDIMRQKGLDERAIIEAWANVEQKLAAGPASAIEIIKGLVSGYKIPLVQLAPALGINGAAAPSGEAEQQRSSETPIIQLPPELINELNGLKQTVSGLTNAQRAAQEAARNAGEARVQQQIDDFKSAKDGKGNLLHPHFDEVEEQMTRLARIAVADKQPVPPLQELYETAVWANPSTREKLRTAEAQQAEQKRKDEARAKAAAAKKAASSVTGAPGPGQAQNRGSSADKSLREQLEEAAEESFSAA